MQKQGKRYSSKKVRQVIEVIIHFRKYNFEDKIPAKQMCHSSLNPHMDQSSSSVQVQWMIKALDENFLKTFSRKKSCLKPIHAVESAALALLRTRQLCPFTHVNSQLASEFPLTKCAGHAGSWPNPQKISHRFVVKEALTLKFAFKKSQCSKMECHRTSQCKHLLKCQCNKKCHKVSSS